MGAAVDVLQGVSSENNMKPNTSKSNETETIDPRQQQLRPGGLPLPGRAALQAREAALYCGVSVLTLKRLAYRGLLHPNRATAGDIRISVSEVTLSAPVNISAPLSAPKGLYSGY
jgi:hypothetical protein